MSYLINVSGPRVYMVDYFRSTFPNDWMKPAYKDVNPQLRKSLMLNFPQENLIFML